MGVPGFFAWLIRKTKNNIIQQSISKTIDYLYIDANCLFHPQCFKILDHFDDIKNIDDLEKKMIQRIIKYLDYLIETVGAKKMVYISVDGVAPMAKMNQQRKRRFKSIKDNIVKDTIKQKYGKTLTSHWSNASITPGTEFMEKLNKELIKYIKNKKTSIIYSSYHTAGEGEHKILDDIRTRFNESKNNLDDVCVIYGLDADLIFLALASQKNNIYLLREAQHFGKGTKTSIDTTDPLYGDIFNDVAEEMNYVSIDLMKKSINTYFINLIKNNKAAIDIDESIEFTNDFIFICYFLGNDFIPHLPSINIKIRGLDLLLDNYVETYCFLQKPIITITTQNNNSIPTVYINNIFLELYIKNIAQYENYFFTSILPKHRESTGNRLSPTNDPYERELWEYENMRDVKIDDPIKLGVDNQEKWKFRYYEHYTGSVENQKETIDGMCYNYMESIKWVTDYYFIGCNSWLWQYNYTHAPFISDISRYITNSKVDINNIKFEKTITINPCIQLLAVLPPECDYLLPEQYKSIITSKTSEILDLYPNDYKIDMIDKDQNWMCIPMIPVVDIERVINVVKNIKLTAMEVIRNQQLKNYTNN